MAGRLISDHSNWIGSPSKESPLPMQAKMKQEMSANGAGELGYYEDTTEAIKASQEMAKKKIAGHPRKADHRN
jgi:hypothetical protein